MRSTNLIVLAFFSAFLVVVIGCDDKDYALAPVSGTITFEGKPVDKLRVAFSPMPVGDNYAVGPYSSGTTNPDGKFTLETRYEDEGAVVGKHTLAFQYSDIGETAMADLRMSLADAQESRDKEYYEKTKKKIEGLKTKLKGRPILKGKYSAVIEVTSEGYQNLELELSDLAERKK